MHEPNVWYHVAGPRWRPGQPLLCWRRLKEEGILTDDDWAHPALDVGYDQDLICFYQTLSDARYHYAHGEAKTGETIVCVTFPPGREHMTSNAEEYYCYPEGEIPAAWIEVVRDDEQEWLPEGMRST